MPYQPRSDRHLGERRAVAQARQTQDAGHVQRVGRQAFSPTLNPTFKQASTKTSKQTTTTVPTIPPPPQPLSQVTMFHAKRLQKELSKVSYPFSLSDAVEAREQTDMRDKTNRSTKVFHQVRSFLTDLLSASLPAKQTLNKNWGEQESTSSRRTTFKNGRWTSKF